MASSLCGGAGGGWWPLCKDVSNSQNKLAAEQKDERRVLRVFFEARFVKKAVSTALRGEALDRRKDGLGRSLEMWEFQ